jgi:hypothetical protein
MQRIETYEIIILYNLVSDIKGRTKYEGVWEQGAQENIWI